VEILSHWVYKVGYTRKSQTTQTKKYGAGGNCNDRDLISRLDVTRVELPNTLIAEIAPK
jgi:hypothetical protein